MTWQPETPHRTRRSRECESCSLFQLQTSPAAQTERLSSALSLSLTEVPPHLSICQTHHVVCLGGGPDETGHCTLLHTLPTDHLLLSPRSQPPTDWHTHTRLAPLTSSLRWCRQTLCCRSAQRLSCWSPGRRLGPSPGSSACPTAPQEHERTRSRSCCGASGSWRFTFGSAGLVENLSLFSPRSSNSWTTRSAVTTANFLLFGAHATAVTRATPSCEENDSN